MYLTYCLHTLTHNLTILNCQGSKKEAWASLKDDAQRFMIEYKNYHNLNTLGSSSELKTLPNGYYYKVSNKYPNRASIYEKVTNVIKGYLYNTNEVKIQKILICGILELPVEMVQHEYPAEPVYAKCIQAKTVPKSQYQIQFMHELKIFLEKRRVSVDGPETSDHN